MIPNDVFKKKPKNRQNPKQIYIIDQENNNLKLTKDST